jgi:purine-binding chemotaxis protein CheW
MSETAETALAAELPLGEAAEETTETNGEKYLIFTILDKLYSLPSRLIGEIALFDTVYPLPLMPDYVPGVINRYSVPYALFDIGLLLFETPGKRNKVLVLKDDIDRIAFLIDDVAGIADVPQESLLDIERSVETNDAAETISASFNWNGDNIFVLDVRRILARVSGEAA